jgi:outer membrane protein
MTKKLISAVKVLGALIGAASLIGLSSGANAADLPTMKAPPAPAPVVVETTLPFFVKLGFTYAINQSTSKIYSQSPVALGAGIADQFPVPNISGGVTGANIANVATVGFEVGYMVMPNISIDVSGGIPMYAKVTTNSASPSIGLSGTKLASIMPSVVPITVLYHFTQFGVFQPYLGGGIAPAFSFGNKDAFDTGVTVDPTVGFVLQAGTDVMFDRHWGWSVDVKKVFVQSESHGTGVAPLPGFPLASTLKTNFQPWLLSTGVVYRF